MKNFKAVILVFLILSFSYSNAQIIKKLKKRAQETFSQKIEEKTEKETEKVFDTLFNNNGELFKKMNIDVEDNYTFSHQYTMEIHNGNSITDITYFLTKENEYMGTVFNNGNKEKFITVMDLPNSAVHSFMKLGNQKSVTSMKIDLDDIDENERDLSKFHINGTGQTKIILGFTCEEFQITGPQLSGKAWVTKDADISFQKAFSQLKSKKMNKGIDQSWVSMVDGLTLEMEMIDYSKKNPEPIKMICTELKENALSIQTSEYQ